MNPTIDIAHYFIQKGNESPATLRVTNMKLQKLLYYAQGWHMALRNGKPLFDDDFQKWPFGPVCPPIYNHFKCFGSSPIPEQSSLLPINTSTKAFLDKIWDLYGKYSAVQLSNLSHREDPWLNTPEFTQISKENLMAYFCKEKARIPHQNVPA